MVEGVFVILDGRRKRGYPGFFKLPRHNQRRQLLAEPGRLIDIFSHEDDMKF